MPKIVKPLSAKELAALPFKESDYFISCGSHLLVKVSGKTKTKRFWCCYTWDGKTEKIAIPRENLFPACSISRAREKVAKIIELWESGKNPKQNKKEKKLEKLKLLEKSKEKKYTFESAFYDFLVQKEVNEKLRASSLNSYKKRYSASFLDFAQLPLEDITEEIVKNKFSTFKPQKAKLAKILFNQIVNLAITNNRIKENPAKNLQTAKFAKGENARFKKSEDFQKYLKVLWSERANIIQEKYRYFLKLIILNFTRRNEIENLTWGEINFENSLISIPGEKMKTGKDFVIPFAPETKKLLLEIKKSDFTSDENVLSGLNRETARAANRTILKAAGFDESVQTIHGFRGVAQTFLLDYCPEIRRAGFETAIELQLAHRVFNSNFNYNKSQQIDQRREVLQIWENYCLTLIEK